MAKPILLSYILVFYIKYTMEVADFNHNGMGQKLKEQTVGMGGLVATKTYSYDKCGNVVSVSVEERQHRQDFNIWIWQEVCNHEDNGKKRTGTFDAWLITNKALCLQIIH